MRLFVSVDMAGSTLFKAQRPIRDWLPIFQAFFEHFPLALLGQLAASFPDRDELPPLDLWKAMGDELVFEAPLGPPAETSLLLRAVAEAASRYADRSFAGLPLDLKVTAWIASFPPNALVRIPEIADRSGDGRVDFIGPDIDLGFRLAGSAQPGSVLLSLPLAEHLLGASAGGAMTILADGVAALRGIAGGRAYPVLRAGGSPLSMPDEGLQVTDAAMLATLSVARACVAGEGAACAAEDVFLALRRRPADPQRAFDLALVLLDDMPPQLRRVGQAAIARAGPDHAYHNRHHLAEAILAMGWLCASARAAGAISAEESWLGVVAMAGHDLGHDGSRCTDGRLEREAAAAMCGIGTEMGLEAAALDRMRSIILETAQSAVLAASGQPAGSGPAGWLGSLAREADVTASLMPRLGWRLAHRLREEWRRAGDPAAEAVAGFAGRRGFLSLYEQLSPMALHGLGLAEVMRAQSEAFVRAAEAFGPRTDEGAAARALETIDRRRAIRLYRAALRPLLPGLAARDSMPERHLDSASASCAD